MIDTIEILMEKLWFSTTATWKKVSLGDIWNCCEGNKLHAIYLDVGNIRQSKNLARHDAVILNRLRILSFSSNTFPSVVGRRPASMCCLQSPPNN